LAVFRGHKGAITDASFVRDGSSILTASEDWTARIWDPHKRGQLATLRHSSQVLGVDYSPDGSRLITASVDGRLRIWSTSTIGAKPIEACCGIQVSLSSNGTRAVARSIENTISVFDVSGGRQLSELRGHKAATAALSPDGTLAVTASNDDNVVRLWDSVGG